MGGMTGVCMVRCNNAASKLSQTLAKILSLTVPDAGPFGGCVPVQMAAGNATAAAAAKRAMSFKA
jgi:hypothetical protein